MKTLFGLLFLMLNINAKAQPVPGWTISFNKQVVLKASEAMVEPLVTIKAATVLNNMQQVFTIDYKNAAAHKSWKRFFYINDENGQPLQILEINAPVGKVNFMAAILVNQAKAKQPVFIYSASIPKNNAQAALVRVKRVLLCKIVWK